MTGGAAFQSAVAFLANLVLVRYLFPEDFGEFALILVNVNLVAAIADLRISQVVLRTSKDALTKKRLGEYTGATLLQTVVVAAGAILLLAAFGHLGIRAVILLIATLAAPWIVLEIQLYEREFQYRRLSIIESSAHLGGHVFTVAGAVLGLGAIVLYLRAIVELAVSAVGLYRVGALRRLPIGWLGAREWRSLWGEVRGLWTDGMLEQLFERLVVLAVGGLAGTRSLGYFYQARRLAIAPHQLLQPLTHRIAFNYFSHRVPPARRNALLLKSLVGAGAALLLVAVGIRVLAGPVIPWLFGARWGPVVPLLVAQLGVVVAMTLYYMIKAYCMATSRMGFFVTRGRGLQYATFGVAVVASIFDPPRSVYYLSIGYSTSFVLPTAVLALAVSRSAGAGSSRSTAPLSA